MPDPTLPAVTTIIATGATLPVLAAVPLVAPQIVVFGIALGLRADVLLAGFCGAVVAMAFFNIVPSTGDTWRELVRTTWRRMWHGLASALAAGYLTPLMMLFDGDKLRIPETLMLSVAFVAGAGAQRWLARFIKTGDAGAKAVADQVGGKDAA